MSETNAVRKPAVAGFFYPRDAKILAADVDRMLSRADVSVPAGRIRAAVAPHAGYQYSGQVAACVYRLMRGQDFHTAVVISPSHMEHFDFSSVFDGEGYETPLGRANTALEIAKRLAAAGGGVRLSDRGHFQEHLARQEHALEVQIPFLQRSLESFSLVPIVMGEQSWEKCSELGKAIAPVLDDPGVVVVASTDLSHFYQSAKADRLDRTFCEQFESLDARKLHAAATSGDCEACGAGPVVAALVATESIPGRAGKILKYANSGDVTGDYESVVGYMSAVITSS